MTGISGQEDTVLGVLQTTVLSNAVTQPRGPASTLNPGDLVGRYVVLSILGAGGMGVVFAAYDPELDRKVAVKLVRADMEGSSQRDRMIREARAMARLSHPNVISAFDAGEHEGAIYIAMEFVEGTTLGKRLKGLTHWRAVLELLLPAGRGLWAAHRGELIHRDFKPDNVMVSDDGRVLVMDFGLARRDGDTGPSKAASQALEVTDSHVTAALGKSAEHELTRAGSMMGTPAYMAPEQFRGGEVDERADQFSFCVTLWEGLYGQRPHEGENMWALATAVNTGERKPPPHDRTVPRWLHAIIERGLAPYPDDRWPTLGALLEAIEHGLARRRNRWIGAAVASPVVLGLVAYGGLQARAAQITQRCEAEAEAMMPWPSHAADLEAGMTSSGQSFAAQSYADVSVILDHWSEAWVQRHRDNCRDDRLDHAIEPELRLLQQNCLESKLSTTQSLMEMLEEGNPAMLVFAVDHMTLLTNLESCADLAALAKQPLPPPEVAPAVKEAQVRLNASVPLRLAGRMEEALALTEDGLARMRKTGFEPGIANAKVRVGSMLLGVGRNDEARAMLEDAYFSAGALADDELAAEAARHLTGVLPGPAPYGIEWVRGWASHAQMLHARLDMLDSLEQAEVYANLGFGLTMLGQPETKAEELELLKKTRDIRAANVSEDHPLVLVDDLNLVAYTIDDPAQALATHQPILDKLVAALGPDHPTVITGYVMTAEILIEMERITEAREQLDRAIALYDEVLGSEHPQTLQAREMRAQIVSPSEAEREDDSQPAPSGAKPPPADGTAQNAQP